ncbi:MULTISPECIES: DUF7168 domain-containing protein [Snodgrassella]|uniref:DUF7168 domain-containing protein n=1 Tax=Snodgrassella TaxID=1193515 RepID=UPI000815F7FE|nr:MULTISPECIES: hypothetical protein [Snodgrassella]SCC08345.1 hypothetical protein GA0061082_10875 [Snodgrassella sp. R-53583]
MVIPNDKQSIEKIKKYLKVSLSANADENAKTLNQAMIMMRDLRQPDEDISSVEVKTSHSRLYNYKGFDSYLHWQNELFSMCQRVFETRHCLVNKFNWSFGKYYLHVMFYGLPPCPELSVYAYRILMQQIHAIRPEFMKSVSKNKRKHADARCLEWVDEIRSKLDRHDVPLEVQRKIGAFRDSLTFID